MSLNIDINEILPVKVSGVCPKSLSRSLILFTTELQRCESWEDVPLEFSRLSIDTIIISVDSHGFDPCNSVLPSFVGIRMLKDPSEAQHRIRQDIDSCALKIDDCFHHQSVTDVSKNLFPTEFCPDHGFSSWSFTNWRGDIEHLLQREIFRILDDILNS